MRQVVVIGGGFGGLYTVQALRKLPLEITLVDRRNHHLFQALLYQVATGALSPANIAAPLRALFRGRQNVRVLLDEVQAIDVAAKEVVLTSGKLPYDALVVAAGATHSYFGHDEWEPFAPGLKSLEDATHLRSRILRAFEEAERAAPEDLAAWLTFVIVGAGPTGVEMAGAIAELARSTLAREFRHVNPAQARIVLVEAAPHILPAFDPSLSDKARRSLERMGVEVLTETRVTNIGPTSVSLTRPTGPDVLSVRTTLWAAGVRVSPLARELSEKTGAPLDRAGRIHVQPDLTLAGHQEIFVIGDMAHLELTPGKPLPGLAPVAMQEGRYVARTLKARLRGRELPPFRYFDKGTMAVVGPWSAIADVRGLKLSGILAWLAWLFVHLMYIVQFHNRVLIFFQWAWHYLWRDSSARLITHDQAASTLKTGPP